MKAIRQIEEPRVANPFVDRFLGRGAPDAPFLVSPPGATLSYGDLRRHVANAAGALIALGVKPGDRVAAQIEKSVEGLLLYLGTVMAGGIFLPLNTSYVTAELAYFMEDAEPTVVVCDPSKRPAIAALTPAHVLTLDADGRGSLRERFDAASPLDQATPREPADLAAIIYTSGTTGRAKGAMLTHGNIVSNAEALVGLWRFTASDRLLHALPIYHLHGLFTAVNTVLAAGASLLFLPKFDVAEVLRHLPQSTVMMGVPTFYTRLLDDPRFDGDAVRTMRLFISGSAPLLEVTHRAFAARTGHVILERYGMTETNMITSNPYERERRAGTVGFPLPGVSVRVVDPSSGKPAAQGDVGMIEVKGPNVFKGYWRSPEKTQAEFRPDGFFVTGDLGRFDDDGYLRISGRGKDLIISGGLNVYPKEIELAIDGIAGIAESAVVGLPHSDLGEGVTAIVVAEKAGALDEESVLAALSDKLAKFKQPRRVVFVSELPRNAMGKVQKNVLRDAYRSLYKTA